MLLDVFASFIIKNLITQPIPTNRRRAFLPKKSYLTSGTWPVAFVSLSKLEQLVHIVKGRQPERRVLDRKWRKERGAFVTLILLGRTASTNNKQNDGMII